MEKISLPYSYNVNTTNKTILVKLPTDDREINGKQVTLA